MTASHERIGRRVPGLGFCTMTFPRRDRDVCIADTFPSRHRAAWRSPFAALSVRLVSLGATHFARTGAPPGNCWTRPMSGGS